MGPVFACADLSQGLGDPAAFAFLQWVMPVLSEFEVYDYTDLGGGTWRANFNVDGPRIRRVPAPPAPRPELQCFGIGAVEGRFSERGITTEHVIDIIAKKARQYGARTVFADGYMAAMAETYAASRGLQWVKLDWTSATCAEQLSTIREWLTAGDLAIEPTDEGARLVEELLNLNETMRPSGALSFSARRNKHDDRAACLRNAAQAQAELRLPGSPIRINRTLKTGWNS